MPPLAFVCHTNLLQDTSKVVQMMKRSNMFKFTSLEDMQAKILEIPYKDKDLSMVLLLPNEIDGLQQVKPCIYNLSIAPFPCSTMLVWAVYGSGAHSPWVMSDGLQE